MAIYPCGTRKGGGGVFDPLLVSLTQPHVQGNIAFRKGDYPKAVKHYETAYDIEPEVAHYQLNLAAAHLKLTKYACSCGITRRRLLTFVSWMEAEKACTMALTQHKSSKGYYRRARARRMLNRTEEAIKGDFHSSSGVLDISFGQTYVLC